MMRTANPALNASSFATLRAATETEVMTLEGTVNKSVISVLITIAGAYWSWINPSWAKYYIPFILVGLILAVIISFKKQAAPTLTPVYALVEGFALGSLSATVELMFPGIVFQAISLTFGTLFCLLMAYKSGLIKPSENFKLGIFAATGAICFVYLISFILGLFGVPMTFMHGSGTLSIGISVVVVVVAALNLVLDFDFIESAAAQRSAPKYMEWYGAFGLLVTLIWLYIEILHLLMKLRSRD